MLHVPGSRPPRLVSWSRIVITVRERWPVRRLLPAGRRPRRIMWVLFFVPLIYAGAQTWHRFADAFGTKAIRIVAPVGAGGVPQVDSQQFRDALAALTNTVLSPGHQVAMLVDGPATMERLQADLRTARRSIALQTYYCEPGRVTDWLKTLLTERARAGVSVYFLRDGFGCASLTRGWLDSLREAGVQVATLRPVRWWAMHESMHRSHVRIVAIDGEIGYVGGFGFADKWIDHGREPRWRETAARFTGPAVVQLTSAFAIGWANATGDLLTGHAPQAAPSTTPVHGPPPTDSLVTVSVRDGAAAGVMFTQRAYGTPVPERFLALALAGARTRVYIANSYFVPNRELRQWLVEAARRGVDVRVLAPGEKIDIPFTHWAGRSTYRELLRGGVRLYEYQPAMMHAKTILIDDTFVSIGSLNLDNLSLRINEEAVLQVQDRTLAAQMAAQFARDLSRSLQITEATLDAQPLHVTLMTGLARLVRDLL